MKVCIYGVRAVGGIDMRGEVSAAEIAAVVGQPYARPSMLQDVLLPLLRALNRGLALSY